MQDTDQKKIEHMPPEDNQYNFDESDVMDVDSRQPEGDSSIKTKIQQILNDPIKKRNFIFILVIVALIAIAAVYFFSSDNSKDQAINQTKELQFQSQPKFPSSNDFTPNTQNNNSAAIGDINKQFAPQNITEPKVPLPPPPPPPSEPMPPIPIPQQPIAQPQPSPSFGSTEPAPTLSSPSIVSSTDDAEKKAARMRTGIVVFGGSGGTNGLDDASGNSSNDTDKSGNANKPSTTSKTSTKNYLGFDGGVIDKTDILQPSASSSAIATKVNHLDRSLIQGKIVDAVLETAINTQLQSPSIVRAIVSRDTYAEQGKNILIPKGSRLVGTYASATTAGQTRILVTWTRVITPSGVDVAINAPTSDSLGRAGLEGFYDDALFNKLSAAFLISYIIPLAMLKATNSGNDQTTTTKTTTPTGTSTSTTSSAKTQMMQNARQQFSQVAQEAIQKRFPGTVTISVDQGSIVKVLVVQDLIFPSAAINKSRGNMLP